MLYGVVMQYKGEEVWFDAGYYQVEGKVSRIIRSNKKITKLKRTKSGELVDLNVKKYKKEYEEVGEVICEEDVDSSLYEKELITEKPFKEHTFQKKKIKVFKLISKGSDRKFRVLVRVYDKDGKKIDGFIFGQEQIWAFKDVVCNVFLKLIPWVKPEITVCNEVKVYIALLREPEYMISAKHLVNMGVKKITANKVLESLEKRGNLEFCGNVGKEKFYSCTILREQLAEMFKPYSEEDLE